MNCRAELPRGNRATLGVLGNLDRPFYAVLSHQSWLIFQSATSFKLDEDRFLKNVRAV